jgi:uncharacterized spore protein YtfJ
MDQNTPLNQNVDMLFTNLEDFTQNEGVLGKPVTHGDKTFIPVVSVTLGYGSGNSASKNQQGTTAVNQTPGAAAGNMAGGALGLGAKLSTDAIIVIDNNNVSMMAVNATGNSNQLMDKIPQILSSLNLNKQQTNQQQDQTQNQQQNTQQ